MIILILLNIYLLFFFIRGKKYNIINSQKIVIDSYKFFFKDFIILSMFFMLYIFFFRFLRIFREKNVINFLDQKEKLINLVSFIFETYNIYMLLIFIITLYFFFNVLKRLLIQKLKLSFIRLNYFFISKSEKYFTCFIETVNWQSTLWYWLTIKKLKLHLKNNGVFFFTINPKVLKIIYYFFKFVGVFILLCCFCFDCIFHGYDLVFLVSFIPWFGLYQTLYSINYYFNNKLNARNDCNLSDYFYPPAKYNLEQMNVILLIKLSYYLEDITRF